jgi:excinuclease ABC subunit B
VAFVGIVDADKTGFLRSPTSLIQTIGRAARNVDSEVVLYADEVTPQMQQAMDETERRRQIQLEYNKKHGITPQTIRKAIRRGIELELKARKTVREAANPEQDEETFDKQEVLAQLEKLMLEAAQNLEFEKAADLRDRIKQLKEAPDLGPMTKAQAAGEDQAAKSKPGTPGRRTPRKKGKRSSKKSE